MSAASSKMASKRCFELKSLSQAQKLALEKGDVKTIETLLLSSPAEISKKAKFSLNEAQSVVRRACEELSPANLGLSNLRDALSERRRSVFTTGDAMLDRAIGGGVRSGMIWELAGESASGKTQLALQLSLFVQLPEELNGLCGASCFFLTRSSLPTERLLQLLKEHPHISRENSGLGNIHQCKTPMIHVLLHALTQKLPKLIQDCARDPNRKPIRLLVIDSLSELFRESNERSANTLFERSKELNDLSNVLHAICTEHNIAVVVINNVTDSFAHDRAPPRRNPHDISYSRQAQWFTRAHSIPAEMSKEAGLGLVWSNQVNARIMLTRTNRRRHEDVMEEAPSKRRRTMEGAAPRLGEDACDDELLRQTVHIRRLTVVFSSVSPPSSVDYIVAKEGLSSVSEIFTPSLQNGLPTAQSNRPPEPEAPESRTGKGADAIPTLLPDDEVHQEDDDDSYWNQFDDIYEDSLIDAEQSISLDGTSVVI